MSNIAAIIEVSYALNRASTVVISDFQGLKPLALFLRRFAAKNQCDSFAPQPSSRIP